MSMTQDKLAIGFYETLDDDKLVEVYVQALHAGALWTQEAVIEICNKSRPQLEQRLWDANLAAGREMEALEQAESTKNR